MSIRDWSPEEWKAYAVAYNTKVDTIIATPSLMEYFDELYEERLAIMETDALPMEEVRRIVETII